MPMQFGKITVETPQEVMARIKNQRQAMAVQGGIPGIYQANLSTALDSLFGNPEVKNATAINNRLKSATAGFKPVEGEDDVTSELRRISAMRDAVQDVSPELANEMTTQMLQLGTIKAERAKLAAQTTKAQVGTSKTVQDMVVQATKLPSELENLDARTEASKAAAGASEASAASSRVNAAAKQAERTNWVNLKTGEMKSVKNNDLSEQARLSAEGYVEAGNPTIQGSKNDVLGLTKPTQTTLQEAVLNAQTQKNTLASIATKFKPSFLTVPKQILMAADNEISRWTGKSIDSKYLADRDQYWAWSRNTLGGLNSYIKSITGAQAAVAEYERIEKAYLSKDMSAPQFVSHMRELSREALGAEKRAQVALNAGVQLTAEELQNCQTPGAPCKLNAIPMPTVSDDEVNAFLANFGIPASGTGTGGRSNTVGAANSDRKARIDAILNGKKK